MRKIATCRKPRFYAVCGKNSVNLLFFKNAQTSRQMDYYRKLYKYQNAGVREYWIINKEKNRVVTHSFEKETGEEYTLEDAVPVGIYEDFNIDFKEIDL